MRSLVQAGKVSPLRSLPAFIPRPSYITPGGAVIPPIRHPHPMILNPTEISSLRQSCKLARRALNFAGSLVKPGMTTDAIDARVHELIWGLGAYPSTLQYLGFPKSMCTSVNEVMVHGIPDSRPLEEGDIVNLDITLYYDGFHGDVSHTHPVGVVDEKSMRLITTTRRALDAAIAECGPGVPLNVIGKTIEPICNAEGFSVSRKWCGHGIGREFHMAPEIGHVASNANTNLMKPGMAFTIEPVVCEFGTGGEIWSDGWTVSTRDSGRSAQFEETVLITEEGCEVLTASGDDDWQEVLDG